LEDCAQSVYCGGQRGGKEGGGLIEDSSLRCQQRRKTVRRRALAWRLEGLASAGSGPQNWRGGSRGGAHEVGREAADSLTLWRLFPVRGGVLTSSWRMCVALLSLMRQLGPEATVCVLCV
jgi:hypothetical protein